MNLNIVGLIANAVGAVLLIFFPPAIRRFASDGSAEITWTGAKTKWGRIRAKCQPVLSVFGFALMALGFIAQLVALSEPDFGPKTMQYLQCDMNDSSPHPLKYTFLYFDGGHRLESDDARPWTISIITPARLLATQEDYFGDSHASTRSFDLNRVTGAATLAWLALDSDQKDPNLPPLPKGVRLVTKEISGECTLSAHRTIN